MKISVGSIQSTWLWEREGGGGGLGQSRCEDCTENGRKLFEIFCERCIQMSFRQWRVAVVVMLSTTILLRGRGGGGSANFNSRFFLPKLRPNIFHSSVTIVINREGWDKNTPPPYTGGMVEDAKFSKTSFKNQSADVKGTLWSTI